jgi:hypothetical protein
MHINATITHPDGLSEFYCVDYANTHDRVRFQQKTYSVLKTGAEVVLKLVDHNNTENGLRKKLRKIRMAEPKPMRYYIIRYLGLHVGNILPAMEMIASYDAGSEYYHLMEFYPNGGTPEPNMLRKEDALIVTLLK